MASKIKVIFVMLQYFFTGISYAAKLCTGWQFLTKLKQIFNLTGQRVDILRQEQMNGQHIFSIDKHDRLKNENLHSLQLTAAQLACLGMAGYQLATGSEDPFTTVITTTAVATTAYDLCKKGIQAVHPKSITEDNGTLSQKLKP